MNEMTMHRIVVLGGGYAGIMAALRAAGRTKGKDVSVTLVDAKPAFVERIRLHQLAAGGKTKERPYGRLLRGAGAQFVQGYARGIDLAAKTIELNAPDGPLALPYDTLVYTLGSYTDRDAVPGVREHAFTLDFDTAPLLRERLEALPAGARVVICGGGLTGIEGATEIAEARRDLQVTLIERGAFAAAFSSKGRNALRRSFDRLGITIRDQTAITEVQADRVLTVDGAVPFDLCLWAGSFAVAPLARDAGLKVDDRNRIVTDQTLRSLSHPEVIAAGDAAAVEGVTQRMSCAQGMPLGAQAGENAAALALGREPQPFRFAFAIWCISLGRHSGLVQMVTANDVPKERIIGGRAAAMIKESICRFTTASIALERRFTGSYHWVKGKATEQTPREAALSGGLTQ